MFRGRSTLALGIWGPRMGIQYHHEGEAVTLPKEFCHGQRSYEMQDITVPIIPSRITIL